MEEHRSKIEEHAMVVEQMGLTPVASRVFIYLMLCDEHGVPFDDMVTYFRVSKSAISNALKTLSAAGMVSYKTIGGQRKRYFYLNLKMLFDENLLSKRFSDFLDLIAGVRKTRGRHDKFDSDLADVAMLYKMMMVEFPIIIERWKKTLDFNKKN